MVGVGVGVAIGLLERVARGLLERVAIGLLDGDFVGAGQTFPFTTEWVPKVLDV